MTQSKSFNTYKSSSTTGTLNDNFVIMPKWYENELNTYIKHRRFPRGSKNVARLNKALDLLGNPQLKETTLLNPDMHSKHANKLAIRFIRRLDRYLMHGKNKVTKKLIFGQSKYGYIESPAHQRAREIIRFVTVIHAVEALDIDIVLSKAKELKFEIETYTGKIHGAACLGVIETEIVSIKQMRRIHEYKINKKEYQTDEDDTIICANIKNTSDNEYRKLNTCEILSSHLDIADINGESGQFLIHFHGVLIVKNESDVQKLHSIFLQNKNWTKESRQIQFKKFSSIWNGVYKSLEDSLRDIAYYITKCGTVLVNGVGYLQYNLDIPTGMPMSYEEYLILNDQINDIKRQSKIDTGEILDIPNLSSHEINTLSIVIDKMMNWNSTRTGYLITVGRW